MQYDASMRLMWTGLAAGFGLLAAFPLACSDAQGPPPASPEASGHVLAILIAPLEDAGPPPPQQGRNETDDESAEHRHQQHPRRAQIDIAQMPIRWDRESELPHQGQQQIDHNHRYASRDAGGP